MKYRWISLVLVFALLLSACAAGSNAPDNTNASTDPTTSSTTAPSVGSPTDPTGKPVQDPTVDPSDDPTVEPPEDPTQNPSDDPVVIPPDDPVEDPPKDPTQDTETGCKKHADQDNNGVCDICDQSVYVSFDFYTINDLHGKLADADSHIGVDELTTFLKNARKNDENAIFLSAGDMWQGSSESNLTTGLIITDWMNALDFTAMTLGNHEFDWGEDAIKLNASAAEFPLLAINVYDRQTNQRVEYCQASIVVEGDGLQIGIIGAIGDCYSSIASDKCEGVYFKTGSELTKLVKAEAERLRAQGVDFIVYSIHDGYESTNNSTVTSVQGSQISSYYDTSLSNGYVDLVFEGHTHQGYRLKDEYGVYHLQNRGDNKGGISHVEISINTVTMASDVQIVELISVSKYQNLEDDPIVQQLLDKYEDQISKANEVVGYNSTYRSRDVMRQYVADVYYRAGLVAWGDKYNITLGGGFVSIRSPGYLSAGEVTYGDLQSLFPFDNDLVLCSVKGSDLLSKFINTSNDNYFISGDYDNINRNATYYIVVDTYSAYYAPNRLTVVEEYEKGIYARDLLADFIEAGGLE